MANSIWQATVQNATGDIIPGAEMTVVDENTGLPATIFSSIGGAALTNPFFADSEGFAQFYAASGTYRVTANDTGTGQSITWRYIRFGDAASRDVGTASGNIPDADDLNMVGNTNYTSGNLNPNVFGGVAAGNYVAVGEALSSSVAAFYLPISMTDDSSSITVVSTFTAENAGGGTVYGSGLVPVHNTAGSNKLAYITVSGLSGLTVKDPVYLRQETNTSQITVNP